jgi:hypothetical protein
MSVTNTKLLITLLAALVAVVVEDGSVAVEGSLIINGGLVLPSYLVSNLEGVPLFTYKTINTFLISLQ